jgi:glycosyltransferase involved in cell wall biosynthesis
MTMIDENRPILSLLIPTRNRANYLKYAIQSCLNISSSSIEIIVSDNHSVDESSTICDSFSDKRLKVVRPSVPLPMHENFEFLLRNSRGEWVTFIGDDDAVMPHCYEHLRYLIKKYPQAEAIFSPRAYYFWEGCQETYGDLVVSLSFTTGEKWQDSKKQLKRTLDCEIDYISLPQMYSGGFHRRSLINRVLQSQNDVYFKSVTPDAYSALMACIHTYRYIETGIPMTWVGSSPHKAITEDKKIIKDRDEDFYGMHHIDALTIHKSLGDLKVMTFSLVFFEAYISAFPITSYNEFTLKKVRKLFYDAIIKLKNKVEIYDLKKLGEDLGVEVPKHIYFYYLFHIKKYFSFVLFKIKKIITFKNILRFRSHSHADYGDILSCDKILEKGYKLFLDSKSDQY